VSISLTSMTFQSSESTQSHYWKMSCPGNQLVIFFQEDSSRRELVYPCLNIFDGDKFLEGPVFEDNVTMASFQTLNVDFLIWNAKNVSYWYIYINKIVANVLRVVRYISFFPYNQIISCLIFAFAKNTLFFTKMALGFLFVLVKQSIKSKTAYNLVVWEENSFGRCI